MIRVSCLVAALLLLAACGRSQVHGPFVESQAPPGLASRHLAPDGWAWGLIQVGEAPPQRYGVSSTSKVPRGQILIVPGYGEPAEVWFETVRDLNAAGLTVWVLDRAGQGGSGRFIAPHDLGYMPNGEADAAAIRWAARLLIRPQPDERFVILAQADGATAVLMALQEGLEADGVILSAPRFAQASAGRGPPHWAWLSKILRRPDHPPPGWKPWRRLSEKDSRTTPLRRRLAMAWQIANPDLRMSGPSQGWLDTHADVSHSALAQASSETTPTLELGEVSGPDPCPQLVNCHRLPVAAKDAAPHLAPDDQRQPWLEAVIDFALVSPSADGPETQR